MLPEDMLKRHSNICINSAQSSAEPHDPTVLIEKEEDGVVDRLTTVQPVTAGEEEKWKINLTTLLTRVSFGQLAW